MDRLLAACLGTLLVLSACAPQEAEQPPDDTPAPQAVCLQGETFTDDGSISVQGSDEGDAAEVSAMRWESHEGCERFVIDLATEQGEPAGTVGDVQAEFVRDLGIVRVELPGVESIDLANTDETFDGPLARASYAVVSTDRHVFVDLHLGRAAEAHVSALADPARVVVDLRPGGDELPQRAATANQVVVLTPRDGEASYPLTVEGYSRTFEANVVVRLEQDGRDVFEDFTTATSWADGWGWYSLTVDSGPTGEVTVHVGQPSARDGTWEGAEVSLTMTG